MKMSKPHPSLPKQDLAAYVLTERARRRQQRRRRKTRGQLPRGQACDGQAAPSRYKPHGSLLWPTPPHTRLAPQIPRALPCPAATAPLLAWASTVIQLPPPPYLCRSDPYRCVLSSIGASYACRPSHVVCVRCRHPSGALIDIDLVSAGRLRAGQARQASRNV